MDQLLEGKDKVTMRTGFLLDCYGREKVGVQDVWEGAASWGEAATTGLGVWRLLC